MSARVPQIVALQGRKLMREPLGGPYHLMLAALWDFQAADVFIGSIRHHGQFWRLLQAIRSAFAHLTTESLCSPDSVSRPLLEASLELLRLIEEQAKASWLQWLWGPRGVFCCAKALDDVGTLVISESLGDPRLPCGRDVTRLYHVRPVDRDLADVESAKMGLVVAPELPAAPAATASAPAVQRPPF